MGYDAEVVEAVASGDAVAAEGDVITIEALGRDDEGFANSPALLLLALTDEEGDPLYDCG